MSAVVRSPGARATLNRLAWEVALDRIELDVVRVERLLRSPHPPKPEPWDEPILDGPIPADLLPRALEIQKRQAVAAQAITAALTAIGRHQAFTDRVTATTANALLSPAYVDLTA